MKSSFWEHSCQPQALSLRHSVRIVISEAISAPSHLKKWATPSKRSTTPLGKISYMKLSFWERSRQPRSLPGHSPWGIPCTLSYLKRYQLHRNWKRELHYQKDRLGKVSYMKPAFWEHSRQSHSLSPGLHTLSLRDSVHIVISETIPNLVPFIYGSCRLTTDIGKDLTLMIYEITNEISTQTPVQWREWLGQRRTPYWEAFCTPMLSKSFENCLANLCNTQTLSPEL